MCAARHDQEAWARDDERISDGVLKLKELLFDVETRTLADLRARLDDLTLSGQSERAELEERIAQLASREAGYRLELSSRLDEVFARAGTLERFQVSVAEVIDRSLRDAEATRHGELSEAIAPLVTRTIKTEIRNSRDDLVEALYPMTGRMVQAYVASAIKDMMNEINRRIGENPTMLRLRAWTSGRSVAELALLESQRLDVDEIYLVRRATGELVDHWPEAAGGDNRGHMMSGILTAINEFASEAFNMKGPALRRLDVGEDQVYIRASPTLLLAAKCKGTAHGSVEKIIDEEFLAALETRFKTEPATPGSQQDSESADAPLATFANHLESRIAERQQELRSGGFNPAKLLLWLIALTLAALIGWWAYATFTTERTRSIARGVIERSAPVRGYPIDLTVAPYGDRIAVSGLTPSPDAKAALLADLVAALPGTPVDDGLTVVASGDARIKPEVDRLREAITDLSQDVTGLNENVPPEVSRLRAEVSDLRTVMAREAAARAVRRATRRLSAITPELDRLAANAAAGGNDATDPAAAGAVAATLNQLDGLRFDDPEMELDSLSARIGEARDRLRTAIAALSARSAPGTAGADEPQGSTAAARLSENAEGLALEAERLATLVVAMDQANAVRPPPVQLPTPTERERLEAFARSHAIFFSSGTQYRDPAAARATLERLVELARGGSLLMRVVGYTDEQGNRQTNMVLGENRAKAVYEDLIALGMPAARLSVVGRADGRMLSREIGETSPNRRVQFEVGFDGERAR